MRSMTKTVIITGANGFLGQVLVDYFASQNYSVRALVRNPGAFNNTKLITYYPYDLTKKIDSKPFRKANIVIHTAYISKGKDVFTQNLDAARALLKVSRENNIEKNIFISSMSASSDAESAYGRQKYAIEQLFNGQEDVIIRSGLIIGNGGLAKNIIDFMAKNHVAPLIGGGGQPIQFVSAQELAKIIEIIITKNISGKLYIGTPRVYTYKEFYQAVKDKRRISALLIPVPYILPLVVIRAIRLLHIPIMVTEDNLKGLRALRSFDTSKDLKKVGVKLSELDDIL